MISIIHPSRGRPQKAAETFQKWLHYSEDVKLWEWILSYDNDDESDYIGAFYDIGFYPDVMVCQENKNAIDAINKGALHSSRNILMVVSDDTDCFQGWDTALLKEVEGKTDWILKTQDGIQPWIITMPVMDRAYYNRTGYIYHHDFEHMFCDTYMTCVADINGRKLTSDLMFKHNHYSVTHEYRDDINKKNDATWSQGEETFIRLMKEFTPEERARITDTGMKRWLRNKGV